MPPPPSLPARLAEQRQRFGDRLRVLRERRSLSQERLAELCGVDRKTISRIETGTYSPALDQVFKVADVLGVNPGELFQSDGPVVAGELAAQ